MKRHLTIILFTLSIGACVNKQNTVTDNTTGDEHSIELDCDTAPRPIQNFNWLDFEYDEARIYFYGISFADIEDDRSIIVNNKLNYTVVDTVGILLTSRQTIFLNDILSGKYYSNDDECMAAACFEPHHGIVFINHKNLLGMFLFVYCVVSYGLFQNRPILIQLCSLH